MEGVKTIEQFAKGLEIEVPYITANAVDLGITTSKVTSLTGSYGPVGTAGTWLNLMHLYSDKKSTRTPLVVESLKTLKKNMWVNLQDIYGDIAPNKWTDEVRAKLSRKTGLKKKKAKSPEIKESCHPTMRNLGGGIMKCSCKTATEAKRASKPKGADGLQIAYSIIDQPHQDSVPDESQVKRIVLISPSQCSNLGFYSKALFKLELDPINVGRNLQYFVRWYNSKHPENAGPWSDVNNANI